MKRSRFAYYHSKYHARTSERQVFVAGADGTASSSSKSSLPCATAGGAAQQETGRIEPYLQRIREQLLLPATLGFTSPWEAIPRNAYVGQYSQFYTTSRRAKLNLGGPPDPDSYRRLRRRSPLLKRASRGNATPRARRPRGGGGGESCSAPPEAFSARSPAPHRRRLS